MNRKLYKAVFFGTPEFAVPALEALLSMPHISVTAVITQPDKPVGKKQVVTPPPVKVFAKKNDIPVFQPPRLDTAAFMAAFSGFGADIAVLVAYGKIIPPGFLSIPPHGWINVHASLLPKYRGASPIQAALLAGDTTTGVTLMQIDAGLDTGPIIAEKKIPIPRGIACDELHNTLAALGTSILKESLLPFLEGKLKPQQQPLNSPTPLTKTIKKQAGKIDWMLPAEQIERQIRAYTPWPGAYCSWGERRLHILDAQAVGLPTRLKPGQVVQHGNGAIVGCGSGGIKLYTLQLSGKRKHRIDAFLRGSGSLIGATLT